MKDVVKELDFNGYFPNQAMDNFDVHVTARSQTYLHTGIAMILGGGRIKAASIADDNMSITLYWFVDSSPKGPRPLPYEFKLPQVITLVDGWLSQATYPKEPDFDGHSSKGFRISRMSGYATLKVEAVWAEHHK